MGSLITAGIVSPTLSFPFFLADRSHVNGQDIVEMFGLQTLLRVMVSKIPARVRGRTVKRQFKPDLDF